MVSITDFTDSILTAVPIALDVTIDEAVREAAIRFCRETGIYKYKAIVISDGGSSDIVIDVPENTRVSQINSVLFTAQHAQKPVLLESSTPAIIDDAGDGQGRVTQWYRDESNSAITVNGDDRGTYKIDVRLVPTRGFTGLPDAVGDIWFHAIRAGALALLYEMPDKPWTDGRAVKSYSNTFYKGVLDATRNASRARDKAAHRTGYGGI